METPDNLDDFLAGLIRQAADGGTADGSAEDVKLNRDQRAFIERILDSVTTGSKGVFVVLHPNERMQYMLLNTNRAASIALLANVIQRTGEALEADVE
jgi:hypothetical protein